jgi:voltage-gated potassium channel
VQDHIVICGYGTKGRSAVKALRQQDVPADHIVVVELDPEHVRQASADGLVTVQGSSTRDSVLAEAEVARAKAVIVAVDSDDTAVLTTLTVRQLAPKVTLVAAVREEENADLLIQSGATSVITSSAAAGRLLGLATESPRAVAIVEDLIAVGSGLDLMERDVTPEEAGRPALSLGVPVLAVVRDGQTLTYDNAACESLRAGDRIVYVASNAGKQGVVPPHQ